MLLISSLLKDRLCSTAACGECGTRYAESPWLSIFTGATLELD